MLVIERCQLVGDMKKNLEALLKAYASYRLINYDPLDTTVRKNQFKEVSYRVIKDVDFIKDKSFSNLLSDFIGQRFDKDANFYNQIYMSRQLFSKIINDSAYRPTRETVMQCCIGLKLGERDAQLLMESAGYGFSRNLDLDLIVKFCIANRVYEPEKIDQMLVKHQMKPLFALV
jgi:hypothetical protein